MVNGLPLTAASVPDGMASASLIGVNPIYGLYAGFIGPIIGGLTTSTTIMVIATTSAASLAAASAVGGLDPDLVWPSLAMLTLVAGVLMVLAGSFGLGRYVSFVSQSVMTGFLTGVATSIVFGQVADLTGAPASGPTSVHKVLDVALHPSRIHTPTLVVGLASIAVLVGVRRIPRLSNYGALLALVLLSVVVATVPWFSEVGIVSDVGAISPGVPPLVLPQLGMASIDVLVGAFAVAVIVLIQGAGVAQSFPNPDGSRSNVNTDFAAQGWANVGAGLFGALPIGGSIGSTASSASMGSRTRWVSIFSGLWMLAVLVALSGLAERAALPTLAAILIVAGVGSISPDSISTVWRAGAASRTALLATFLGALLLPVAAAVGVGVALSLILHVGLEARDIRLVEMYRDDSGAVAERPTPEVLTTNQVVVLNVHGSLFYAGARQIEVDLPAIGDSTGATVVLRLRGRVRLGATAVTILTRYSADLSAAGGRLVLAGVDPQLVHHLRTTRQLLDSGIQINPATPVLGESTLAALAGENYILLSDSTEHPEAPEPLMRRTILRLRPPR